VDFSTLFFHMDTHKPRIIHPLLRWALIFGLCLFGVNRVVAQQAEGEAVISQLEAGQFPLMTFYLETRLADSSSLSRLSEEHISVIEDGAEPVPIQSLEVFQPGFQVIVAYNIGPAMANTTQGGKSRFLAINEALLDWLGSRPDNSPDDFSLAGNTGLQSIRMESAVEFANALASYQPDFVQNQPNLTSLLQALDLSTDPNPHPLTKRTILYITPQPTAAQISAFPGMIDRAVRQNVQVNVWLVAPASAPEINAAVVEPLLELAERSGGEFFLFSGVEELPDPEDYFRDRRFLHQVQYRSAINSGGNHIIRTKIDYLGVTIQSNMLQVELNVQPPNPVLIDPPLSIDRTWNMAEDPENLNLLPVQQTVSFFNEFPDGHQRELVSARLLIDDVVVAEINKAPFQSFDWDVSTFDVTRNISLKVEVEDNLGLVGQTQPVLVSVSVAERPLTFWQSLLTMQMTSERWIILGSVVTTGSVLVVAIILAGRRRAYWRERSAARKLRTDPLTQPVIIRQESLRSAAIPAAQYPQVGGQNVAAWLVPLNERFEAMRQKAIPLNRSELVIGRDTHLANLVISSEAIEMLHAVLTRKADEEYWLADNHSAAGTWVNYAPLSAQGLRLQHGDLVHFAKTAYRFEIVNPPDDREARLITYNKEI
jgi:hypothetical protein